MKISEMAPYDTWLYQTMRPGDVDGTVEIDIHYSTWESGIVTLKLHPNGNVTWCKLYEVPSKIKEV